MTDYSGYRTDDKTMPWICYGLFLGGFVTAGITSIVAVIMAYAQRGTTGSDILHSHYTFMIRTFWMGLVWIFLAGMVMGVGIPLSFILIGIPLVILAKLMWTVGAIWYGLRTVMGMVYLSRDEAYPRPYAILA